MSGMLAAKWDQIEAMPDEQLSQALRDELLGYGPTATPYQIAIIVQKSRLEMDSTAPVLRMLVDCLVDAVDGHMADYRTAMRQARIALGIKG